MTEKLSLEISKDVIESFCRKWKIKELALFGSVLRGDFRPDSDVDVLATFAPDAKWSVFDHARMSEELSTLLGREADVVETTGLRNPFRSHEILATRRVVYDGTKAREITQCVNRKNLIVGIGRVRQHLNHHVKTRRLDTQES